MDDALWEERPRLRRDLYRSEDDERPGYVVLRDPETGHVHNLSPVAAAIAELFDGQHTLAQIRVLTEQRFGTSLAPDEILAFVEDMHTRMLLVDAELEPQLETLRAVRRAEIAARFGMFEVYHGPLDVPIEQVHVREDLRYACLSCGVCCSGRFRVELLEADMAALTSRDLTTLGIGLEEAIETRFVGGDADLSQPRRFLRHRDGRCVFLGPDLLCEIHRRLGYDAKPTGCRIFPFYPLLTPDGAVIQFRPECSTQYRSRRTGPLVAERREAIWREITENFEAVPALPARFALADGASVDYAEYARWEARWLDVIRNEGWRRGLAAIAQDLGSPSLAQGRPLQQALVTILDTLVTTRDLGPETPAGATFRQLVGDRVDDAFVVAATLASVGIVRPEDRAQVDAMAAAGRAIRSRLPALERPELDLQLDEYLLDFLSSKLAFHGLSLASGMALGCLAIFGARRAAALVAGLFDEPPDARLLNEAIVGWHLLLFNKDGLRAHLLVHHQEALEAIPGLPPGHF